MLIRSGTRVDDLLMAKSDRAPLLQFEALETITMPLAVPEDAWRVYDPGAENMVDQEWLL